MVQPLWRRVWQLITIIKCSLTVGPNNLLYDIYPREIKIYFHAKTCTQMFIAAIFIIVRTRNNTNVLQLVNGCTNRYIYTMEYYSTKEGINY